MPRDHIAKKLKIWSPAIIWMGVIFALSSIPGNDIPKVRVPHIDKLAHIMEFLILDALLVRAFFYSFLPDNIRHDRSDSLNIDIFALKNFNLAKAVFLSIIVASVYAALDEWHQSFVPDRTPDIVDFSADVAGIIIGAIICRSILLIKR